MANGILEGVRIIDLTQGLPGPVAAMLLAEAGADVIKVEPPTGDPMRANPAFASWNRSKRSVVCDLSTEEGLRELDGLLAGADVLMHSLRPEIAARFRLGPPAYGAAFLLAFVSTPASLGLLALLALAYVLPYGAQPA